MPVPPLLDSCSLNQIRTVDEIEAFTEVSMADDIDDFGVPCGIGGPAISPSGPRHQVTFASGAPRPLLCGQRMLPSKLSPSKPSLWRCCEDEVPVPPRLSKTQILRVEALIEQDLSLRSMHERDGGVHCIQPELSNEYTFLENLSSYMVQSDSPGMWHQSTEEAVQQPSLLDSVTCGLSCYTDASNRWAGLSSNALLPVQLCRRLDMDSELDDVIFKQNSGDEVIFSPPTTSASSFRTCLKNHELCRFRVRPPGCFCSSCLKYFAIGSTMWGCDECNWQLCDSNCYKAISPTRSPPQHTLKHHEQMEERLWNGHAVRRSVVSRIMPLLSSEELDTFWRSLESVKAVDNTDDMLSPVQEDPTSSRCLARAMTVESLNAHGKVAAAAHQPTEEPADLLRDRLVPSETDPWSAPWDEASPDTACRTFNMQPGMPSTQQRPPRCRDCPGKHGLKRFVTDQPGFSCELCSHKLPKGSLLWGCRKCDWDVCPEHLQRPLPQKESAVQGEERRSELETLEHPFDSPETPHDSDTDEVESCASQDTGADTKLSGRPLISTVEKTKSFVTSINCPGHHGLQRYVTKRSSYTCNLCRISLPKGANIWSCRLCNFDVCSEFCTDRERWKTSNQQRRRRE